MIVDLDDFCDDHAPLDLLHQLRDANPLFRCTLFAIPAMCSRDLLDATPEWCEVAVHGWEHGDPPTDGGECRVWTQARMADLVADIDRMVYLGAPFVRGFKAPGWQISDGCYRELQRAGWWVADQPYNDQRRPRGILVHRLGDGDHWHGHTHNVCGNGIEETFPQLLTAVTAADTFETVGETVKPWC